MRDVSDAEIDSIIGHFERPDRELFRLLLASTADLGPGDLAELGVYYGASAVLIGSFRSDEECFTVIDLFEAPSVDAANAHENASSYPGLTQADFEANYVRIHGELPTIVRGPSETIVEHAAHGTHRFVHVDASHLYEHVHRDVEAARVLLRADGVVVFDDFREEHTPGVAAAVWQSVIECGLRPFALSPHKLYGTWGDPAPHVATVERWAAGSTWQHEVQAINGLSVLRLFEETRPRQAPHPLKRYVPEVLWPFIARTRSSRLLRARGTTS